MNENVENLILAQLREMRMEMKEMRMETADMRAKFEERFESLDSKVDGVSVLLTALAGYVHRLEERVEVLEDTQMDGT